MPVTIRQAVLREVERRGWSLLKLAQETGISYSRIHDWLAAEGGGKRGPNLENVEKIMTTLGLRVCENEPPKRRRSTRH